MTPPCPAPAFDPHSTALVAALLPSRVAQARRLDEERIADVVNVWSVVNLRDDRHDQLGSYVAPEDCGRESKGKFR